MRIKVNMKLGSIILGMSIAFGANASTTDCRNLYVGSIQIIKGTGLQAVVYLNAPEDNSGSYWSNFSGWTAEDKKAALSVLMMAKASKHRVNVATDQANGCGLQVSGTTTTVLELANIP